MTDEQFLTAEIWGDAQVTLADIPLPLTSVASKELHALGIVQVRGLWDDLAGS